ncbi:MAG: DUF4349 domain-containing protein [Planctomycetaceae bacterium]|nr:DUF4349 domain-containing protein [Planctomycetaceae bacterium]
MKSFLAFSLALLLTTGCGAQPMSGQPSVMVAQAQSGSGGTSAAPISAPRMLIQTVELALVVDETEQTVQAIQDYTSSLGGYVESVDAQRYDQLMHYTLTLKVPQEQLTAAVDHLKGLAKEVDREHLTTEDVTDRVVDLEARLKTLRATESELQALLAESREQKRDAENIMAIYRELTEIRTQVEQFQGQLASLEQRVAFSTIQLTLRPSGLSAPVSGAWHIFETVRTSVRLLIKSVQFLTDALIFGGIVLTPLAILLGVPLYLIHGLWRRFAGGTKKSPTA